MTDVIRFDRARLQLLPLGERVHDMVAAEIRDLESVPVTHDTFSLVAERIRSARARDASVILMMGAHVIRSGVQRYLIDLMEQGLIQGVALNGGGMIHDFELALIGATTESVARYIAEGQFGLWRETGRINEVVIEAAEQGQGLGAALGQRIEAEAFPHRSISILAAGYRLSIPVTVHVGIGYDIVHEHPNCDGAAYGKASYADFLAFAHLVEQLEGGVVMNFGSAVMAPEVYLKALAMARNVAHASGRTIRDLTTLVCDLVDLPADFQTEAPKHTPGYYYRPWKTMLVRTVRDGGQSYYVRGPHAETVPQLWSACGASGP